MFTRFFSSSVVISLCNSNNRKRMLHTMNSRVLISNSQSRVGAHNAVELEGVGWVKFLSCGYAQL